MRELERSAPHPRPAPGSRLAVVGRGRLGTALASALTGAPFAISGPLGRDPDLTNCDAVLLCVPDGAIAEAAARVPGGRLVGHCSGALGLAPLAPHEAFSLHPLMSFPAAADPRRFAGAGAAVAGSTPRALAFAEQLGAALGLRTFTLLDEHRSAYHAAASLASNFLVTLEGAAERLAGTAGLGRELLVPLVHATVESWSRLGAERALTGPIVRGDEATVTGQRQAVAERTPELLELFDALAAATRSLASGRSVTGGSAVADAPAVTA